MTGMTHDDIHSREIPEAYVRGRLSQAEREAFEDHFFGCDECFQQVTTLEQFLAGVRDAAGSGQLPEPQPEPERWLRPGFVMPWAAALGLAAFAAWALWIERPRLQTELAQQQQQLQVERARSAALEKDLSESKLAVARPPAAEPNLPLIMLEASRSNATGSFAIVPPAASQVVLWVEPAPGPTVFRMEIQTASGAAVETINHLVRNNHGALAASLPATRIPPGKYRARLYAASSLVGDYAFEVRR